MQPEAAFDWVTARHNCSLAAVFERLKDQTAADVKIREGLRADLRVESGRTFVFQASLNSFRVFIQNGERNSIVASVSFRLADGAVEVSRDEQPAFKGFATLCDDGECRLKVEDQDLNLWQFRKRALEDLFFVI